MIPNSSIAAFSAEVSSGASTIPMNAGKSFRPWPCSLPVIMGVDDAPQAKHWRLVQHLVRSFRQLERRTYLSRLHCNISHYPQPGWV